MEFQQPHSFSSPLESLRNLLHFNNPSHFDKWTNTKSESKFRGHVPEYILSPRERGEHSTVGSISYCNSYQSTIIMTLFEAFPSQESKTHRLIVGYMKH